MVTPFLGEVVSLSWGAGEATPLSWGAGRGGVAFVGSGVGQRRIRRNWLELILRRLRRDFGRGVSKGEGVLLDLSHRDTSSGYL